MYGLVVLPRLSSPPISPMSSCIRIADASDRVFRDAIFNHNYIPGYSRREFEMNVLPSTCSYNPDVNLRK